MDVEQHITLDETLLLKKQIQRRDARCPFNYKKVQYALEDILSDEQSTSLSMRTVARRLSHPVKTIETHFPIQCRQISCRYREYRKQQGQLRKARLRKRIHQAAHIALTQGETPTYQRVGSILGEPGCFREHEARLALLDVRYFSD